MTLKKTDVVDWLGIEKDTGAIVLTLTDDEDWTAEREHLLLLQGKLNRYLDFIESGEVYGQVTERLATSPEGRPLKVSILAKYALPVAGADFIRYAQQQFMSEGIVLSHKVLPVE